MSQPDYQLLCAQVRSLAEEDAHWLPLLSNVSALIMDTLTDLNWAGFYLTDAREDNSALLLGPFQGKVACVHIAFGKGVCGTAAAADEPQLVPNVHEFPGHIACDSASNSEVVIPLYAFGQVVGVLDIDSPLLNRFSAEDFAGLKAVAFTLDEVTDFSGLPLTK